MSKNFSLKRKLGGLWARLAVFMAVILMAGMQVKAETLTVGTEAELTSAFSNAASGDVIKLTANINLTNNLVVGEGKDFTIDLNGFVLKGTGSGSVITLGSKGSSSTAELTITDSGSTAVHYFVVGEDLLWTLDDTKTEGIALGDLTTAPESGDVIKVTGGVITGGNSEHGGAVCNYATLTINGGNIVGNSTDEYDDGGGVYNSGTFTMTGGNIAGNNADDDGGGVYTNGTFNMTGGSISNNTSDYSGGGVYTSGTFNMTGGSISNNNSNYSGGGVYNYGTFTLSSGNISGNISNNIDYSRGGGVYNGYNSTFTMNSGSISGNSAEEYGGGVYNSNSTVTITGGSISGNSATGNGGGMCNGDNSTVIMTGGSISGNSAKNGGGVYNYYSATFTMTSGSISGNSATNNGGGVYHEKGTVKVGGTAIITGNTKETNTNNVYLPENKVVVVATGSDAPQTGMNVGVTLGTSDGTGILTGMNTTDYSQYFTADAADDDHQVLDVDCGDYHYLYVGKTAPTPSFVARIEETGQLFEDINKAIENCSGNTVKLMSDVNANLTIKDISSTITLDLNGKVIKGDGTTSVVYIDGWYSVTFKDSNPTAVHYFNYSKTGAWTWNTETSGEGAIEVSAITSETTDGTIIKLYGGVITGGGSKDGMGGGIYCSYSGQGFTMTGGNIVGNTATDKGGGVYNNSKFTMTGGTIVGNTATNNGGGVYINYNLTMEGGTIVGNTAGYGGGVYNNSDFTMEGGTIVGNRATNNGGGMYDNGTLTISGTVEIANNTKGTDANNIYLPANTTFTVSLLISGANLNVSTETEYTSEISVPVTGSCDADYSAFIHPDIVDVPVVKSSDNSVYFGTPIAKVDNTVYSSIAAALTAAGGTNVVMLVDNVAAGLVIESGQTHIIDLNGFTLSADNTVVDIKEGGTFTLTDTKGGGKISGGTVGVSQNGTMYLQGKPSIIGNTEANLYLPEGKTVIIDDNSPLEDGAGIAVKSQTTPSASAKVNVTGTNTVDYSNYFLADQAGCAVIYEDGIVKLTGGSDELSGEMTAAQARAAFSSSGTSDASLTGNLTITDDNSIIVNGGVHNLYLGGYTFTGKSDATKPLFALKNGAVLNIYGGTKTSPDGNGTLMTATTSYLFSFSKSGEKVNAISGNVMGLIPDDLSDEDISSSMKYYLTDNEGSVDCEGYHFDINGMFNNSVIQTSYDNGGYPGKIQINDNWQYTSTTDNGGIQVYDGIQVKHSSSLIDKGTVVKFSYTLYNNTDALKTVKIANYTDIQIGDNDDATVYLTEERQVISMTDTHTFGQCTSAGLRYTISSDEDSPFTGVWIGDYDYAEENAFYTTTSTADEKVEKTDSGCSFHWAKNLQPGQTATVTCYFQIAPSLVIEEVNLTADAETSQVHFDIPYKDFPDRTQTLYYTLQGDAEQTKAGSTEGIEPDASGFAHSSFEFSAAVTSWPSNTMRTIDLYATDNVGYESKSYTFNVWWPEWSPSSTYSTVSFDNTVLNFAAVHGVVGQTITLPADESTTEKTFNGWNTKINGTGTHYDAGDNFIIPDQDMTLYAQWIIDVNALTIVCDDEEYAGEPIENVKIKYGTQTLEAGAEYNIVYENNVNVGEATATISGGVLSETKTLHFNIHAKVLNVSGIIAYDKPYDGTTAVILNTENMTVEGIVGEEDVTVSIESAAFADANAGADKTVNITFTLSGEKAGNYLAKTSETVKANIYSAEVVEGTTVVGTYASVQDAVEAQGAGQFVRLITDVVENVSINSGKTATIDLNGHVISASDVHDPVISVEGALTLIDNVGGGNITGADYGVLQYGTLTLGGKINITDNTYYNLAIPEGFTVNVSTDTPLVEGASIGVYTEVEPTATSPVAITGTNAGNYAMYFTSDAAKYIIVNEANVVKLRVEITCDTESSYEPTQIVNGSFKTQPTYAVNPQHGVGEGWNTTDPSGFEWASPGGYTYSTYGISTFPSGYDKDNYFIEMNNAKSAVFSQDLATHGGDVIRWGLWHGFRDISEEQRIRAEIGAPNGATSGTGSAVNANIKDEGKAVYNYNGVTHPGGTVYGYASNLGNLRLPYNSAATWYEVEGVYVVPKGQTTTRFAFIAEEPQTGIGNCLDQLTFSTLVGNLQATTDDYDNVIITGYWGDTDTTKKLCVDVAGTTYEYDMSEVKTECDGNFRILFPNDKVGDATTIDIYHQDYPSAKCTVKIDHYKQITNNNISGFGTCTFTLGLNAGADAAIFTDNGQTVNGNTHAITQNVPFTVKIGKGFKYYDGTVYDMYVKITPRTTSSETTWKFNIDSNYFSLYHGSAGTYKDFDVEIWLQHVGTNTKVDNVTIVGGSCSMGINEGARPYSDDGNIYTNIPDPTNVWQWNDTYKAWVSNNSGYDQVGYYIIGHGVSADNSLNGGYYTTYGFAEFVVGYMTNDVTFRAEFTNGEPATYVTFSYPNPATFVNNVLKVPADKAIGTLPEATPSAVDHWYIGDDKTTTYTSEELKQVVATEDMTVTAVFPTVCMNVNTGLYYVTVQNAIDAAENNQTVKMIDNATENVTIPNGKVITLDLNGYTITSATGNTVIANNGTLTLTDSSDNQDGTITGARSTTSSMYYAILNVGTFYMYAGTITDNDYGFVNNGTFYMYGGAVTGNYAGVMQNVTMTVGGTAKITGNVYDGNYNLCLPDGKLFSVATGEYAPATGMNIGIAAEKLASGKVITVSTANGTTDYSNYFTADAGTPFAVFADKKDNMTLKITDEVKIILTASPIDGGDVKIYDATTGLEIADPEHIQYGTLVTIKATQNNEWAFKGWFNNDGTMFSGKYEYTFEATENHTLEARFTNEVIWVRIKK